MTLDIYGENEAISQGVRRDWDKSSGETGQETYRGPAAAVTAFYESLINDPTVDKLSLETNNGQGTATVTRIQDVTQEGAGPNNQFLNVTWEVIPQDIYKALRSFGGRPEDNGTQQFNQQADQEALEETRKYFETAREKGIPPLAQPGLTYLALLLNGVEEFVRTGVILRSRIQVASNAQIAASWQNVDRAITFNQLNIGNTEAEQILGALNEMDEFEDGKRQFLKRGPSIRETSTRRFSIEQDYWFARRWSYNLYGGDNEADNP